MQTKLIKLNSKSYIYLFFVIGFLFSANLRTVSEEFNSKDDNKVENVKKAKDDLKILKRNKYIWKTHNNKFESKIKQTNKVNFVKSEKSLKKELKTIEIERRGYILAEGPRVTINFKNVEAKDALMAIAKLGNYSFIYVPSYNAKNEKSLGNKKESRLVTVSFVDEKYHKVLNSILMASGLQGKKEGNVIFVGNEVLNKGFKSEFSKIYKMNNTSAASAADYLASLGAIINKVSPVNLGINDQDQKSTSKEFKPDANIQSYGSNLGPLKGLMGTSDSRMETITLIGSLDLIKIAEKYIQHIDKPLKQVAMSVKILDVNVDDEKDLANSFALKTRLTKPNTYILNDDGMFDMAIGNINSWRLGREKGVSTLDLEKASSFDFLSWLNAKITSKETKVLASPTIILSERKDKIDGGEVVSGVEGGFSTAAIGRPYGNESFITVGTKVITNYNVTAGENGAPASCEAEFGTAGLTFGAKLHKISSNNFINFSLSPELSSITSSMNIGTCGLVNILSIRRLDTGAIRVKNGDTLVLTGVLSDTNTNIESKIPILGDIPFLGNLFKSNRNSKKKNELIILVTPNIINEEYQYFPKDIEKKDFININ